MSWIEIILLGIALAMDACVVSFSYGLAFTKNRVKNSLMLAAFVGFFQFLMPVIGFYLSGSISRFVEPISKWLVFVIFVFLGIKFIIEAFEDEKDLVCCISWRCLLGISIATSIDALAAGASLYFTKTPLLFSVLVIGFITFLISMAGFWAGNFFKKFPSRTLEISGGVILILLAIKTLTSST